MSGTTGAPVPKLSVREKVGYGFGDLASNLFWQMFSIFVAKFYTDVFLLSAATMGTMLLVTRVADAFVDPVIGAIADRTRTRWGHFRPYLVWMALPMAVTAVATFTVPSVEGTARVAYAYVTLMLMMIAYSAINIPYSALLGVLTPDSADRTSASSYRFVMALIPVFIIVNTALPMAKYFGGSENAPAGWQMTMVIYSAVAVVFYLLTFAMTRERVQPEPGQKTTLRSDIKDLLSNKPWVVLSVVGIAALTYANIRNTVAIYYFENVVPGGKDYFGPVMTTGAVAFIAGVMLTSPLSRIFGKRRFYMASMGLTTVLTAAFYFVPNDNIALIWAANTVITFVAAPTAPLVWAMYADSADYSEWKTGRRATGLTFSAASFAQKLGWALGGAGTGWLLAYFGYQAGSSQSAVTVDGIMMMMSVIPAVGSLIAAAALWFYQLDDETVKRMGEDLRARRARDASPEQAHPQEAMQERTTPIDGAPGRANEGPAMAPVPGRTQTGVLPMARAVPVASSAPAFPTGSPAHPPAGAVPGGRIEGEPHLGETERRDLDARFRSWMERGIHGLCFSPYVAGQGPGTFVAADQIRARLDIVKSHTRWVRTFSCTDGHEQTPRLAREAGLRTMAGAWLGKDPAANEREMAALVEAARAGHVDIAAVGNEVLLREDLSEDGLLACIDRVKAELPGIPVGYVDAYYLFEQHPKIAAACDVLLVNCYPFWEGCPRGGALAYMQSMVERVQAVAPGKRIIVSETGWPDRGSAFHGSVPSTEGAMRYFIETMDWAAGQGLELFWFSAFDESWKVGAEGDVGAYWGLWDEDGRPKFGRA